jgi:hypothetical protein
MPGNEARPQVGSLYFDLQADFGITKHLGGRKATEELRQLDLKEYARAWRTFFAGFLTNPDYRRFTREVLADPQNLFQFTKYIGGGLYVGRK